MSKSFICFALIIVFVFSCNKREIEDPFEVAKNYCNCVEEEMKAQKDSLINIYDCEKKVSAKSRLMSIYMASYGEYSNYNQATKDSAEQFFLMFRNITDTMCFNKFDPKRIKKIPHIPM